MTLLFLYPTNNYKQGFNNTTITLLFPQFAKNYKKKNVSNTTMTLQFLYLTNNYKQGHQ